MWKSRIQKVWSRVLATNGSKPCTGTAVVFPRLDNSIEHLPHGSSHTKLLTELLSQVPSSKQETEEETSSPIQDLVSS